LRREEDKMEAERKKYLESIKPGDLVWRELPQEGYDQNYLPAVVKLVNVEEDYIGVIDVSDGNKEKKYYFFLTDSELVKEPGFSRDLIKGEYKKHRGIIRKVLN
jgi:hypothetical protein